LFLCLTQWVFSQDWLVVSPYAYNDETVVYATLQSNVPGDPMTDFVVAAFIDGECRAEAVMPSTGVDGSQFFILRVRGDQTDDKGKTITFKAYHKPMRMTYDLTPARTVLYTGESEGTPSNRIVLSLQRQTGPPVELESLFMMYDQLVAGKTTRVELVPVPNDATFDAYSIALSFSGPFAGWDAIQVQRVDGSPLFFDLTPQYPGKMSLQATLGGQPITIRDVTGGPLTQMEVGASMPLESGWHWRSNPYGDIVQYNIGWIFPSEQFIEARTQQALLYNDPTWGYFGTLMEQGIAQNTCYKLKMASTATPATLTQGRYVAGYSVTLDGDWTWVGCPYYYDRLIGNAVPKGAVEGMVIVTKENGSAEYDGTTWKGDLKVLRSGEGLMVYNPTAEACTLTFTPESLLPQGNQAAPARAAQVSPWHYDASRFMNNTTIVATLLDEELSDDWSVGVFVGDECRGEGHYVDGLFFITAHTERGEAVSLRLCHEPTGRQMAIDGTITTNQMRLGSLSQPVVLHSQELALSVHGAEPELRGASCEVRDLTGRRVTASHRGIQLRRQTDGTVRKVIIK
jgi:hypothetical protein